MPFSTFCTYKECGKQMEPFLDPKTNKAYCALCEKELTSLTHFAKVQMKALKQFREKKKIPFGVKCKNCEKEDQPLVVKNDIVCPGCKKPHTHLSEPFKIMLREQLKTANKDIA